MKNKNKPYKLEIMSGDSFEVQVEKLMEALEKDPKGKSGYYRWLFFTYLKEKQYDKALEYINLSIECCTDNKEQAENYGCLALLYDWQGIKKEEVISLTLKASELDPDDEERLLRVCNDYMEEKDYKNALITFDKFLKLDLEEDECNDWEENFYEVFSELYTEKGNYKKANKIFDELLKNAETDLMRSRVYSLISEMQYYSKNISHAITNAKLALELAPDNFNYIKRLAKKLIEEKKYDEAEKIYKNVKKLKNTKHIDFKIEYYTLIGEMYCEADKIEEAIKCYEKQMTLFKNPLDSFGALSKLAALHAHQRQYEAELPYLKKIIELWPNQYPRAYTSMAVYYYKEKEDMENALNYLFLAAEANFQTDTNITGNDAEIAATIYGLMGKIYYHHLNDEEKALTVYMKSLECKPNKGVEGEICDDLYEIYSKREDKGKATEYKERRSGLKIVLDLFSGDWTPPPPKTLHERLRNPKNKPEEITEWAYHHSKIPEGIIEHSDFIKQMNADFETDLITNPAYKEFFAKHDPYYNIEFIRGYVKHKASIIEHHKWYTDPDDGLHQIIFRQNSEEMLEMILQKKLFNMQLQWRAEQITIPEIKVSYDFDIWEQKVLDCSFLEPITKEEIAIAKEFILSENFSERDISYNCDWQNYDAMMLKDEEGNMGSMPAWYEFYDEKMNTGNLLLLKDIRGEKERAYTERYYVWKRKQPPEVHPKQEPYVHLDTLFASDEYYTKFMELFENDYLCNLHQNWLAQNEFTDKEYDDIAVKEAINTLEYANELVTMDSLQVGMKWNEAVISCANEYRKRKLAGNMDEVYSDYTMKRELNLAYNKDDYDPSRFKLKYREEIIERILKARELEGEPIDMNF